MAYGNTKTTITLETKIDDKTLHFLPFVPTRKRREFQITKKWGEMELFVEAPESINTYDLVTLMFMTRAYLKKNWYAGYIGDGAERREIAGLELDLEVTCKERGIHNKKVNRKTIYNSIRRLGYVDINFRLEDQKEKIVTKYIYETRYDDDYKKVKIYANKNFIEFILNKGILINLSHFVLLEHIKAGRFKEYAILLYSFLNGTKTKSNWNGKKILKWRERYKEELLFEAINLNTTEMIVKEKRRLLKQSFDLLHKELGLPLYHFDKTQEMWIRTDLIDNRLNKIN